jgi:hypothetical protein
MRPEALLHTLRTHRIEHAQPPARGQARQRLGGAGQRLGGLHVQPGAVVRAVEVLPEQVVRPRVAQVDRDARHAGQWPELGVLRQLVDGDGGLAPRPLHARPGPPRPPAAASRARAPRATSRTQRTSSRAATDKGLWLALSTYRRTGKAGSTGRHSMAADAGRLALKGSTTAMPAPASTSERAIW